MHPADVAIPLTTLLDGVLTGVRRDITGELGTAVSIARSAHHTGNGQLQVLTATGVGQLLTPITTGALFGPSLVAAGREEPVITPDLWQDPRWPQLTVDVVCGQLPAHHHDVVSRVRGAAAVPGVWDDEGLIVLSVYLDRPADETTLAVLARHERLVASAVTIADVATRSVAEADQVLDALAARAYIDQAKGVVIALRRCGADEAWDVLRRTSQHFNVKLRELALALVEHVGREPARQPDALQQKVNPGPAARQAAALLWLAFIEAAPLRDESSAARSRTAGDKQGGSVDATCPNEPTGHSGRHVVDRETD